MTTDADTLCLARLAIEAALDRKAEDPVAIDVSDITSYTDVFVVLTGRSDRQVRAIADAVGQALKASGHEPLGVEGTEAGQWILIDAGELVIHIFDPDTRERYDLERLWQDGAPVDLSQATARAALARAEGSAP